MKTRPAICNRKKRFATREAAEEVAARAPFKLRVYKCSLCRRFHLTSRTKGMKLPPRDPGGSGCA
ncbi:hypothetical protein CD351_04255 [Erythrobacter sp. KY5]|uniref:hypothetical protein n=1 Tax=Erythrobacter sp. KY5 TaxID=2011159 RepID=UPI000DBF3516|nr:hypothetical protein [Erythrobacter sp. KY5]AWW73638.1 hypothetical protein CD351_04255 [Erythrobacter sp. KY5]